MPTKAILLPKISVTGIPGFLLWARREQPRLYGALVARFPEVYAFEERVKIDVDPAAGMGGLFDIFTSVASKFGSVAGTIGRFVGTNGASLLNLGGSLVMANQQKALMNAQMRLALAQQEPAQTAIVQTPGGPVTVPVQPTSGGTGYQSGFAPGGGPAGFAAPTILDKLRTIPLATWLIGGGALASLWLIVRRK